MLTGIYRNLPHNLGITVDISGTLFATFFHSTIHKTPQLFIQPSHFYLNPSFFLQVPIPSWFDDPNDRELLDLLPILEAIAQSDDIYSLLQSQGFTMKAKQSTASILMQLQQQMQMEMPVNAQDTNEHDERQAVLINVKLDVTSSLGWASTRWFRVCQSLFTCFGM